MSSFDETSRVPGGGWPPPGFPTDAAGLRDAPPSVRPGQHEQGPTPTPAPAVAYDPAAELEAILPRGDVITLDNGMRVRIKPLRTMELLAVVDIALSGLGPRLGDLSLDPDEPVEQFVAKFAGLLISSLGGSRAEAVAFLRMVCEPADKVSQFRPDRAQRDRNAALDRALDDELANPHPDDTISILEKVAEMNGGDLHAWGKRLAGIWKLAQRTGKIPASPTSAVYPS